MSWNSPKVIFISFDMILHKKEFTWNSCEKISCENMKRISCEKFM